MEKWERHVANEFKEVRYQFEVIAGRFEDMSWKVEDISGQMDQLQRMIQQVANNSSSAALCLPSRWLDQEEASVVFPGLNRPRKIMLPTERNT